MSLVDFGQWIAGPLAAMLLADQGAEVTHVDPPGGPRWKTPANATFNRGKASVALDLKSDQGRAHAWQLIDSADVVIENFRSGVMDRLGLGSREAMERHPHLIYCSLPGFASDDPRASMPAWEGVLGAATGVYLQAGEPRFTSVPISSTFGANAAGVSIVMALIAGQRDGLEQRIEVPLFDATFEGIRVVDLTQVLAGPTATRTLAEFGADVVKVNNPREEGAGYRWQVHRYHTDVNRGKRTILVDLKMREGLDVLWRLVERADVVMQNFRLGSRSGSASATSR